MKVNNDEIIKRLESGKSNPDIYYYWSQVNESLVNFEKKATYKTFKKLYDDDAGRLHKHFFDDCNCKFQRFLTYLTQEQRNELIYNAHENKSFLYS